MLRPAFANPLQRIFVALKTGSVYVHMNMSRITLLKRWRPRIRLPRRKRRKPLQQLELNLWQKRR
jgi:hypothetical protein